MQRTLHVLVFNEYGILAVLIKQSVEYLGHVISVNGVATDPSKVECMKSWPLPKDVEGLRGFLGLTGYYRKFVKDYGTISRPLTELLKKDGFLWTDSTTAAFEQLKAAMVSAPVLALPDFAKPFVVEMDACDKGIGAVLMQDHRPIAYLSKALGPKNQGLSVYEKEFLAILLAVTKWKHYLVGNHFVIKTDQQSLKYILEQKVDNALQQKWISKLLDWIMKCTVTVVIPNWVTDIVRSYDGDDEFLRVIQAKSIDDAAYPMFSLQGGVLRKEGRICVGKNTDVRHRIVRVLHDSSIVGHSGINGTYKRLRSMFFWGKLKEDVVRWIPSCDVCQKAKAERVPYPGLLQPLPVPHQAWSSVSMDFSKGFPNQRVVIASWW
ncbi:UNVERIFIED_CONTAM: Retrovirus-related Pol polyprotein from transposon.6 [Sesamum calycinum]|uniref:Retrovirus-related Pol polyprotein from transposon.6 n=1 Tax=Sesamum calycinum TaxID=2727403 RepID=A0AAW2PC23_9LAMI